MEMMNCPSCNRKMGCKRALGWGTFFAVLATGGLWFLAIPFYPKRCIGCGSPNGSVPQAAKLASVVGLMIVGISLLLWAGWHNLRERRLAMQKSEGNHVAQGKATGATEEAVPSLRGKAAPGFALVDLGGGKRVSLSDYKGRAVVVNFWATWCAPCKLEMPWFEEFHKQYAAQGLEILGIAEDEASKDEIAKAVKKIGVTYPILLTDGKVAPAYGGVDYLPMTFYVDRNGTVAEETAGLAGKDEVEANIKKIVSSSGSGTAGQMKALPAGGE
jgi:thiol-disulfide isomerase/thioredoxin